MAKLELFYQSNKAMQSDEMTKVLIFAHWPENVPKGGVGEHTVNLVKELATLPNLDISVISFGNRNEISWINKSMIKIIKSIKLFYLFPLLPLSRLVKETENIKPNIIHIQGSNLSPYLLFALFMKPRGIKTLITIHALMKIEWKYETNMVNKIVKILSIPFENYAIAKFDHIIVCSPAMKKLICEKGNPRIDIIPNGIQIGFQNLLFAHGIVINRPALFFIGRLEKVKGVEILIYSIPKVLSQFPDTHLYIAGSGSLNNSLLQLTKDLGIRDHITFLGWISDSEKYSYFKSIDICVVPSMCESFGIVILEAMALGKPVIASNVGGIPDIIENEQNGLLFERGSVDELSEKIVRLLRDKDLYKKISFNSKRKANQFGWDEVAKRTFVVYNQLMEDK
jgi:glycosyltransferase involved in cell wall biosynthesis